MREVRVFDGDFPSCERILAGDPTAVFPKEIWLQQVQPGESQGDDLGFEAGQQGERVIAADLLQFLGAEQTTFLQPFYVIGKGARRVIRAE